MDNERANIGIILKRKRLSIPMTLQAVSRQANISPSHLGRIERGDRFPSARVLRRLAAPLGYDENELFTLAGYLTPTLPAIGENNAPYNPGVLDPVVARLLSQEPLETQRHVITLLSILKSLAKNIASGEPGSGNQKA